MTSFTPASGEPIYVPLLDDEGNQVIDDDGQPVFDVVYPQADPDRTVTGRELAKTSENKETAGERTIRHAREAMRNMNADFGAAISEIYSSADENGQTSYFVFVSVGDGKTVKAKKIGTTVESEAADLTMHAITVLCDTVCQKIDAINASIARSEAEKNKAEEAQISTQKKLNPAMIAVTALVFIVAIIGAILLAHSLT